ncbi:hypothetical protein GW17_00008963 [Ensete ventricosum]|nr:hypothetical protein GW17_00008963 [Ensete ventricosum]
MLLQAGDFWIRIRHQVLLSSDCFYPVTTRNRPITVDFDRRRPIFDGISRGREKEEEGEEIPGVCVALCPHNPLLAGDFFSPRGEKKRLPSRGREKEEEGEKSGIRRFVACGTCAIRRPWAISSPRAGRRNISLRGEKERGDVVFGASKQGIIYAWDLRGGRPSYAFQSHNDVRCTCILLPPGISKGFINVGENHNFKGMAWTYQQVQSCEDPLGFQRARYAFHVIIWQNI